ncbi:unnamed protein product [Discula destructiva]
MTSTQSQPATTPAQNTTAATSAPSYASAAGAAKKPASTPLVVTGANPPSVAGSSVASSQNVSIPLNGQSSVPLAGPTVANGTSSLNGDATDHSRNGSVSITAPGNGFSNAALPLKFGYDKTPQPSSAVPIPAGVGHVQQIPSPALSPAPIPQPSASGGKPGTTESQFKIGSFTDPVDRIAAMRGPNPTSVPFINDHTRRGSNVSHHSDMGHHGGPSGPNRGGYAGGRGGGRGGYNTQYNPQAPGYPPGNYNRGPPFGGQGRGGMIAPQPGYGRGPMQPFTNSSPRLPHGSPAMSHAVPGQGTPNMPPAMPVPPHQQGAGNQYPPPMSGYAYQPQVGHPFSRHEALPSFGHKQHQRNKKGNRRNSENKSSSHLRRPDFSFQYFNHDGGMSQRLSKRWSSTTEHDQPYGPGPLPEHQEQPSHPVHYSSDSLPVIDLAPGPEKFGRVERMLTDSKQGYNAFPQPQPGYDPRHYMGISNYAQQPMYAGSPGPSYYGPGQFQPPPGPQAQSMSRGNSQMSERPASSTGPQGPLNASGPPPPSKGLTSASPAASTGSTQFQRPKNAKITIKNPQGEQIDFFKALKTPASPAPSAQQSKTPPVIASTPTPPPKAPTPASHARNESSANPDDIKATFAAQVKKRAEADAAKAEEKNEEKTAADEKAKADEHKQEQDRVQAQQKAADAKAADEKAAEVKAAEAKAAEVKAAEVKAAEVKAAEVKAAEVKAAEVKAAEVKAAEVKAAEAKAAEAKAADEAEKKAKADADEKAKAEASAKVAAPEPDADGKLPGETEDEYWDRIEREMAEKDAIREAEQAEITAKKNAEKEAAKKAAGSTLTAEENDRKLREQEREMERIEEAKEKARELAEQSGESKSVAELLAGKISSEFSASKKKDTSDVADKPSTLSINSSLQATSPGSAPSSAKSTGKDRRPAALNLAPLKTGSVEAPPPSAAMQALKSSRFLTVKDEIKYPAGILSPNPASNPTAAKKGGSFKYDSTFLLQFQKVFTEQPSTEFSQQVKALIGESDGSRSASTRGSRLDTRSNSKSAGGGGAFGAFTQPAGGKALPPGTSSEQRFAMSQGQIPRPAVNNAMSSFGRGTFPSGSQMGRAPSGIGMGSRQGSTRTTQTRGNSSRQGKGYDVQNEKLAKTMPLTANMEIKAIEVSSTGWKPMSLTRNAQQPVPGSDLLDPATVQRKVKSNLNKMTPENFDKISGQILQIAAQSKDETDGRTLRQVIQLTFEKATDEAHWAAMYAKFCQCMLENMSPEVKDVTITDKQGNVVSGGALFRKYLLNRCQEDFERGWNTDMPAPKDGENKEAALMSDEYYKAMAIKRRGLGLIQFIGELFRLGMLTERIMHECVRKLLDFSGEPDEAEIESLTKLLRTIGADLDNTEKGTAMMNAYFQRIQTLVDSPGLPSRLQFMLMDIIDLRKAKWVSKDGLKGPKTREEIRADAEAALAAKAAEASRSNTRGYQGQGQGRFNSGRGDARGHNSFQPNPASNNVAMDDLRRLKGSASRAASGNVSLGPTSMFNSRSNSGRRMGPGGSLTRGNEDSASSSRTGTPGPAASSNTFAALAQMSNNEDGPASPPSAAASPALNHAKPDKSAN